MFKEIVICSKCRKRFAYGHIVRDGFKIRVLKCKKCGKRIYHPVDLEEYKKFLQLKQKPFEVKLRIVGNSYAVSIPKKIIEFLHEQEKSHQDINERMRNEIKKMHKMVKMFLESSGKISLLFDFEKDKK